ncbi:hypothetical protein JHK86_031641 [Glycine max]|nr:hypothetical protein JHK86_031641 [Glycine max]
MATIASFGAATSFASEDFFGQKVLKATIRCNASLIFASIETEIGTTLFVLELASGLLNPQEIINNMKNHIMKLRNNPKPSYLDHYVETTSNSADKFIPECVK